MLKKHPNLSILDHIKSDNYTLHSHTQFCDGRAAMHEFAAEANRQGFCAYGFTPHSPIPVFSTCNMKAEDVDAYIAEANRLKELYPNVDILTGMEIDYLDDNWGPAIDYFQQMPLDFAIGSVHFIPSQDGEIVDIDGRFDNFKSKMEENFHGDIRYVVETFFAQSQRMVEAGGFDIIGHFDKIKHNGGLYMPGLEQQPWYNELVDALIDSIIDAGVIVEINTKAWKEHQQLFPAQRHWRKLLKAGVPIIVNSDAHYTHLIDASRKEVLAALDYLKSTI